MISNQKPHPNSFDLLRLLASSAVLYSHQHALLGFAEPVLLGTKTLGFFGVMIFFILSGWLIAKSWLNDPRPSHFLRKRALRIFPALLVVVILTVFLLGPGFTSLAPGEYFADSNTWRYLATAFLWIQYKLPGVFTGLDYPEVVNGSLWTLPVEVLLYFSVLIVGVSGLFKRAWASVVILLGCALVPLLGRHLESEVVLTSSECLFVFWWGVNLGLEKSAGQYRTRFRAALALGLGVLALSLQSIGFSLLVLLASSIILIAARINYGSQITRKIGDWSYGVYIFAFPVQQMVISTWGAEEARFWPYFMISLTLTYILAGISWHLIEKPFIRLKPKATSGNSHPKFAL